MCCTVPILLALFCLFPLLVGLKLDGILPDMLWVEVFIPLWVWLLPVMCLAWGYAAYLMSETCLLSCEGFVIADIFNKTCYIIAVGCVGAFTITLPIWLDGQAYVKEGG
eukprot:TRINITY_DN490_c0_g1_i7.p3 TRINITY_DN490_c0_g1~~TRINITY_DN490_c0_g1_i7.p3  ORF type:complete len:109 (-),score=18.85 TRINITY_DN490_c0_g1_i7:504-830(-)